MELADVSDSKSDGSDTVSVQTRPPAPISPLALLRGFSIKNVSYGSKIENRALFLYIITIKNSQNST